MMDDKPKFYKTSWYNIYLEILEMLKQEYLGNPNNYGLKSQYRPLWSLDRGFGRSNSVFSLSFINAPQKHRGVEASKTVLGGEAKSQC